MPGSTTPEDYDVYIGSLDMDGCVLNTEFRHLIEQQAATGKRLYDDNAAFKAELLRTNAELLAHIKANQASQNYLVCGSARQDFFVNAVNAQRYIDYNWITLGSATAILKELVDELSADPEINDFELEKLLLGSIFTDAADKDSYFDQVNAETEEFLQETDISVTNIYPDRAYDFVFDESKLLIIYAQIHHAAMQNPGKKIHFEFFDDREDILTGLYTVFTLNPDLIPPNLTLTLTKYKDELSKFQELQGDPENVVDEDYARTIKFLAVQHYGRAGITPSPFDQTWQQKITRLMQRRSVINITSSPNFVRNCMRRIKAVHKPEPVVPCAALVTQFGLVGVRVRGGAGAEAVGPTTTADSESAAVERVVGFRMAAIAITQNAAAEAEKPPTSPVLG